MLETRFSSPASIHPPNGYSHVAEIGTGRLVYIAGQVALSPDGQVVGKGDFAAQVEQVFDNVRQALESVGGSFTDVAKLNYFCVDRVEPAQLAVLRSTRDRYVNVEAPPASTLVFVSRLVNPDWLIEIEAVAAIRSNHATTA